MRGEHVPSDREMATTPLVDALAACSYVDILTAMDNWMTTVSIAIMEEY